MHLTTSKLPLVHQLNCVCMYIHHAIKLNEIFVRIFYSKAYIKEHVVMKIFKEQYTVSSSYSAHTVLIQCALSCYNSISTIIVYQIPVHIISYYLISCHIILYNKSYYIRLCYVVSYYIISYQ